MYSNIKIVYQEKHQNFGSLKFLISVFLMFSFFSWFVRLFYLSMIFYFRSKNHILNKISVRVIEIINFNIATNQYQLFQLFQLLKQLNCLMIKVYTLVQIMHLLAFYCIFKMEWKHILGSLVCVTFLAFLYSSPIQRNNEVE